MELTNLKLENFQGLRSFELRNPGAGDVVVRGANGTGKTTIANAISWLLFGKPASGEKSYNPKTVGADGEEQHHLHHLASGEFRLEDGSTITLTKDFYENWQKVRGHNTETYKGNNTDYYIDGVPVKEKEYTARLSEIFEPGLAPMLTLPDYFVQTMSWQARREILLQVCGGYADADVISAEPELEVLGEKLQKGSSGQTYTMPDFEKMAAARKKKINEALRMIPARIDEASKAIDEETKSYELEGLEYERDEAEKAAATMEKELREREAARNATGAKKQIAELKSELAALQAEQNERYAERKKAATEAVVVADTRYNTAQAEYRKLHAETVEIAREIGRLEEQREKLLTEYKEAQEKQWAGAEVCPTCGQRLPEAEIERIKAEFNKMRSETLMRINKRGEECSKDTISRLSHRLGLQQEELRKKEREGKTAREELERAEKAREGIVIEETDSIKAVRAKIADLSEKSSQAENESTEEEKALRNEICRLRERANKLAGLMIAKIMSDSQKRRIAELEEEEKRLAAEYEEAEYDAYLADLFARTKAKLLDERINGRFKSVRFRLFETQINGGQVDACTVMVETTEGLKPYAKANTGAKIRASIEIMDTLGDYYGVHLPIVIDNAEAITGNFEKTTAQQLRLYATDAAQQLEYEVK